VFIACVCVNFNLAHAVGELQPQTYK